MQVNTVDGASEGAGGSKWKFAGSPEDLFEHHPQVGEIRVLQVTVECTSVGTEQLASGTRDFAKFAVRETTVGNVGTLKGRKGPDGEIPGQMSIDDDPNELPRDEYGDYVPDAGGDHVPPAADVLPERDGEGRVPVNVTAMFSDGA